MKSPALSALSLALAAALAAPVDARADTRTWIGASGAYWTALTSWVGGDVPRPTDNVILGTQPGAFNVTARFDDYYAAGLGLNSLTINSTGIGGVFTLSQTNPGSGMRATYQVIGQSISGNVYQHSTGTNTASSMTLGESYGGAGTYDLSGSGTVTTMTLTVGQVGYGLFNQSGGTVNVGAYVSIGQNNTGESSIYNLSGGTLSMAAYTSIGVGITRGDFFHSGGTLSFAAGAGLEVANATVAGVDSTYVLSDTGQIVNASFQRLGRGGGSGVATFTQTGGSNGFSDQGVLNVGDKGNGAYNMSGGTLDVAATLVGNQSGVSGTFTQTGGTVNSTTELSMGLSALSTGTYNLSGTGSLTTGNQYVGFSGRGVFNQSGGSNSTPYLSVGNTTSAGGTYNLSGGTLTIGSAGSLVIGRFGTGELIQTGGSINGLSSSVLWIGQDQGSLGRYQLTGGTASMGEVRVGSTGLGMIEQSGGTLTTGLLTLGGDSSGLGLYVLSSLDGGATLNSGSVLIGAGPGNSTFRQVGGTHTVAGNLSVGVSGAYFLDGGGLTARNINVQAGGRFDQTGGAVNASVTNDSAVYVSGGSFVGSLANNLGGSFSQTGGTVNATVTNSGTFNASGGSFVGALANNFGGYFTQRGGTVNGTLTNDGIFSVLGGSLEGTLVNRYGGLLDVQAGSTISALVTNDGTFSYQGGSFLGSLVNGVSGTVYLNGVLTAGGTVTNEGAIAVGPGSGLGGSMLTNNNSINMTGGQLTGADIVNNGSITGSGSFASGTTLTNYGQIVQSGGTLAFNSSNTTLNLGSIILAGGRQLRLQSGTLDNLGSVVLNGALVSGAGTLQNSVGGTVSGGGVITARLVNLGSLVPGAATLNVTQAWTNSGLVQLTGPTSVVTGGPIANSGTIQGLGMVGSTVANTGTIEAIGGTLTLGGALSNAAGGNVVVGSGSKLLAQGGLATNAGLISLTGGTFDNGGKALNNTAQITGYGTLSTGGLTNTGTLTLATGVSTVNGTVTNAAGGQVEVAYGNAIFSGAVVNNGNFKATSANVVFAGGFTNNGSYVSDPSTQSFASLSIGSTGTLTAGAGDVFKVSGNFINGSTQAQGWDTSAATLMLTGAGSRSLVLAGANRGADYAGYTDNYSWGSLQLGVGLSLNLGSDASRALYTGLLVLDGGLSQLASVSGAARIYYDGNAAGNAWLQSGTYAFGSGGGALVAVVPEPASALLALFGLAAIGGFLGRKHRSRPSQPALHLDQDSGARRHAAVVVGAARARQAAC